MLLKGKITVYHSGKNLELDYYRHYHSAQIERIIIRGKNKSIEVESNRPALRAAGSKKKIHWKLTGGIVHDLSFLTTLFNDLTRMFDAIDFPFPKDTKKGYDNETALYVNRQKKIDADKQKYPDDLDNPFLPPGA